MSQGKFKLSYEMWNYTIYHDQTRKKFEEMPVLRTKFHNSALVRVKIVKIERVYEQSPITLQ